MTSTLAPILANKLPEYVRESYPNFVSFIKDHIAFLEQDEGFLRIIQDWKENNEISLGVEPYAEAILRDMGFESGQHLAVNKALMLEVLRDFYLERGNESSFKLLFRALFNTEVDIRYPRDQMLVPSVANYSTYHYIFTTSLSRDLPEFESFLTELLTQGGTAEGVSSGAVASIENAITIYGSGIPYLQLRITLPTIEFEPNEQVVIRSPSYTLAETIKPVLQIKVIDGGSGYRPGDQIMITGSKVTGRASVKSVTKGKIDSVLIKNGGIGYTTGQKVYANSNDDGFGFTGSLIAGPRVQGKKIIGVTITDGGYNYTGPVELVPADRGQRAVLVGLGSNIGKISSVSTRQPFVDFSNVTFSINTEFGSGAVLQAVPATRWSYSAWEDEKGVLGINSTLIDSDKYQQFSYQIVSSVPATEHDAFVDELLHPAGYIRSNSFEIMTEGTLDPIHGSDSLDTSSVFEFEHSLSLLLDSTFTIDSSAVDEIVDDLGNNITTHDGTNLIAVS